MQFSLARQCFIREICQPEAQICLERAALYIAQEEDPTLNVEEYLYTLDRMAEAVQVRLPDTWYPLKVIQTINQYLYDDLGFSGNQSDYYDPRNSYLNQVIDRRLGIPITLSLVYLAIAKRIHFPMVGIGFPGHFLIRPVVGEMDLYVDAFNRGEVLFKDDCAVLLGQAENPNFRVDPNWLTPVSNRQFLARMLVNLKATYINSGNNHKSLAAIDRILLLFPDTPTELRDRGIIYYQMNRWVEARQDLEQYLTVKPTTQDRKLILQLLAKLDRGDRWDYRP
ncbi:transglutaminase-like domain-containing protein [Alkalinema sp. FACHB-956]|uniref:SirB1 family protein n=1 Tax=Alkalinema sp. FACHB-956 TaxID=2692768 RepID=UPI0016897369|nr:transglutaminase-like domain-containing protein [Alkalinema sp. FACHB-956]MBD2327718.1 tetratricopeptide repeat protein [Alkalinema sp. FACHB-956]